MVVPPDDGLEPMVVPPDDGLEPVPIQAGQQTVI
jgi:hypothetical protein